MKHSFCDDWEFTHHWTEAFGKGLPVPKQQAVRLPHTCREVPLHYASPADYEMVCGYRKRFRVPPVQAAPRLFVRFDGAAHKAVVRVNGRVAGQHRGGYTGFAVEITDLVDREGENLLTVQLDTREDPAIPPFGFVIDYLTYGGLYREVWLEATAESRLTDLFVHKQDTLENGDLGVLVYGDEGEGTLKRYIQRGNCVVLQPFNPAYNELVIKGDDLNRLHIAGRVVETKAKW